MATKIETIVPAKLTNFVKLQGIQSSKRVFKYGLVELNGIKIQVSSGETLESFASKINRKKQATKIEAVVISNGTHEKLLLKSKKAEVKLIDFSGVFKKLYQDESLGVDKNSLIQIIRDSSYIKPCNIVFNYSVSPEEQSPLNANILSEINRFELSKYTTNNEIDDRPKLTLVPKASLPVALAPITIPVTKVDITLIDNIKKKKMDSVSKYIINGAIHEAIRIKGINSPSDILVQKLEDELGEELSSKYEHSSINDFSLKSISLIDKISKKIANSHESSWMRIPFSTEELKVSNLSIAIIKNWIKNSA